MKKIKQAFVSILKSQRRAAPTVLHQYDRDKLYITLGVCGWGGGEDIQVSTISSSTWPQTHSPHPGCNTNNNTQIQYRNTIYKYNIQIHVNIHETAV